MGNITDTARPALLALDWGTSSLRAYLMDAQGAILEQRRASHGIQHLPDAPSRSDGFALALDTIAGDWLREWPMLPAVASGMVGSAQGWREAPYVSCPAGLDAIARHAAPVTANGRTLHIAPGVLSDMADAPPDVMRGEEIQVFGALALEPALADAACIVLPGTHSKWVGVRAAHIVGFASYMTGELYAVLRAHSTLGLMMDDSPAPEGGGFQRGVRAAAAGIAGDLPHQLFAARTLGLTARLPRHELADYLSGLLIGHELVSGLARNAALLASGAPFVLVGEPALCQRYQRALELLDGPAPRLIDSTAPAGLHAFSRAAGLLAD
ncbi:MAG: 2-dehydro-3-deoxygalactonokinase [Rhodocyclaceae bacterium]